VSQDGRRIGCAQRRVGTIDAMNDTTPIWTHHQEIIGEAPVDP
jgi:hypothetical protein